MTEEITDLDILVHKKGSLTRDRVHIKYILKACGAANLQVLEQDGLHL